MTFRQFPRLQLLSTFVGCCCLSQLTACNDKYSNLHPVVGKVTFEGEPIPLGKITFYPEDGSRPATGELYEDGSYELKTYDDGPGAVTGQHKVTIDAVKEQFDHPGDDPGAEELTVEPSHTELAKRVRIQWLVPIEYSRRDTSPLMAEVKPEDNVIDFDLPVNDLPVK